MSDIETPRTLIDQLNAKFKKRYQSLPLVDTSLEFMDILFSEDMLGKDLDQSTGVEAWDFQVQRVPFREGASYDSSHASITLTKTIPIVGDDTEYGLWSTIFRYQARGIEMEIEDGDSIITCYTNAFTFGLEARGVLHRPERQIDWTKDPANIKLHTKITRDRAQAAADPRLLVDSGFKRSNIWLNPIRQDGLFLSPVSYRSNPLNHQRFTGLYDLASADSRTLDEVKEVLDLSYRAKA